MKEYSFIIWDNRYTVKDEDELALIFELLSWNDEISGMTHWNVIMELDENLLNIIKTYKWLIKSLKLLNERNSFLLLVNIWDSLIKIIQNSEQLWEILARISEEENKIRIIKQLRQTWLKKLILEPRDLSNVLEWLYGASEIELLNITCFDHVKNFFNYPKEIYDVLHYLNNENKDILINSIWLKTILEKIKNRKDLLLILKWVSMDKAAELLSFFSKQEIKDLFTNNNEFVYFLSKLSDRKEDLFLRYLWIKK
ncbi:MAG: hypothetical protein ACD_49C00064G0012 [uncultured bacterium (gcode 4)]|uniref:Uncharacterized protein n=1 Tax=uncultured bacterium (gcode 4) TaxID=1234023 RepID=K2BV59_9BACT|nr:MAG: hypothetical protein ACD_49C00064G0012 [uncultured bacterium (gcode 4)]